MATVNPVQHTTFNLVAGDNPITFGNATQIVAIGNTAVGVSGAGPTSWTVNNDGLIGALWILTSPPSADTSTGIDLQAGGVVTNKASGVIIGYEGVRITGGVGRVTNDHAIVGGLIISGNTTVFGAHGVGVTLGDGGSVTNALGAAIVGPGRGVYVYGASGAVTNAGNVTSNGGPGSNGVDLAAGGKVINHATGNITGTGNGIYISGGLGTVTNAGDISVSGLGGGVWLQNGGAVTNTGDINVGSSSTVIPSTRPANFGGYGVGGNGVKVTNSGSIFSFLAGIDLEGNSSLTNEATGVIAGEQVGVIALTGAATVTNAGAIFGNATGAVPAWLSGEIPTADLPQYGSLFGSGVSLLGGGAVTNAGSITGASLGVFVTGAPATVTNSGTIKGIGEAVAGGVTGAGVELNAGGSVTNAAGATISGYGVGVWIAGAAGVVTNAGNITSTSTVSAAGVALWNGGSVTNQSGGTIHGHGPGVQITGGDAKITNEAGGVITSFAWNAVYVTGNVASVTNAGYIGGATSVKFTGAGKNTLTLETGSTLVGAAIGSLASGATNALVLEGEGTANNNFYNFTTLTVKATGTWTLDGVSTLSGAATIDSGTLQVGDAAHVSADLTIDGKTTNKGVLDVGGGTLDIKGAVTGTGTATIGAGTLELGSTFTENVSFTGSTGVLDLAKSQSYTGVVSGFSHSGGTELDLRDIGFVGPTEASFSGNTTGGTLTVTDGTHTAKIALFGNYLSSTFVSASDGHGGTLVHDPQAGASSAVLVATPTH